MAANYNDKIALITGGSSGIGLALASRFAEAGAHVWILARNQERLTLALKQLESKRISKRQCFGMLPADVSSYEQVQNAISELEQQAGTPDVLINSAGIAHPGYFESLDLDIFRRTIEINYLGTVYPTKAVVSGMIRRGSGHIVNLSSLAGLLGIFGYTAYGASKYAVRGFSDALRAEMKPYGIRVSIVFPPDTETPQLAYEEQFKPPETREIAGNAGAMKPEAVAEIILKGITRNRYMIIPGIEGNAIYHLSNLIGGLVYPIMDMLVSQAKQKTRKLRETLPG